ncbi:MAG: hypothetical protein WB988_26050 [Candidatus Nitrosopolaris sp.]
MKAQHLELSKVEKAELFDFMKGTILAKTQPLPLSLLLAMSFFPLSQKILRRSVIAHCGTSTKSRNARSLPMHFSLVLGDLIAKMNALTFAV